MKPAPNNSAKQAMLALMVLMSGLLIYRRNKADSNQHCLHRTAQR